MVKTRLFMNIALGSMILGISFAHAVGQKVIFRDNFNREDAVILGNGWLFKGEVVLKDRAVHFKVREQEFRPRIKHAFPVQREGKFTVSFLMDWVRKSEGAWEFYMQLGNSKEIPRKLVYQRDLAKGIGVNLAWGGGEHVDHQKAGSFGYFNKGEFKKLFIVNDLKVKPSVVEKAIVRIDVDVDAGTYSVIFNGKTYPDLPFDNKGPIDTIRFITNGCSETGFSRSSIDDVTITKVE